MSTHGLLAVMLHMLTYRRGTDGERARQVMVAWIIYFLPHTVAEQLDQIFNVELPDACACAFRTLGQGDCVVFNDMIEATQKQLASIGTSQQKIVMAVLEFVKPALSCENARIALNLVIHKLGDNMELQACAAMSDKVESHPIQLHGQRKAQALRRGLQACEDWPREV